MKTKFDSKSLAGVLIVFVLFSSLCIAPWSAQGRNEVVKIEPSRFSAVFNDLLREFRNEFPEKPLPPPEKDEFETTAEFEARRSVWKNSYEKAVTDYRMQFLQTVPVFELYDIEFDFGRYNADKGCFEEIMSSRFRVTGLNPVCEGYKIDAACTYGPLERYAHVTIKDVCINRERAKTLKADIEKLRLRLGFTLVPPYPKERGEKLELYIHHLSIYDKEKEKTLFTLTDTPIAGIKHGM